MITYIIILADLFTYCVFPLYGCSVLYINGPTALIQNNSAHEYYFGCNPSLWQCTKKYIKNFISTAFSDLCDGNTFGIGGKMNHYNFGRSSASCSLLNFTTSLLCSALKQWVLTSIDRLGMYGKCVLHFQS